MIQGKSLNSIVNRVTELESYKVDKIVNSTDVRMKLDYNGKPMFTFSVNTGMPDMYVNDVAHSQIANWLNIANSYYSRMLNEKPELLVENTNAWFNTIDRNWMFRTYQGNGRNVVRAVVSDRFKRMDNIDLINNVVLPSIETFGSLKVESAEITDKNLYIQLVSEEMKSEVPAVGDIIKAGIFFGNSELGYMNLILQFLLYTLACTNGMISGSKLSGYRRKHIGSKVTSVDVVNSESAEQIAEAKSLFFNILSDGEMFNKLIQNLNRISHTKPVIDVKGTVTEIGKDYAVKKNEQELISDWFNKQPRKNQYGLLNAVTRTAQEFKSYDRAVEFEQLGGKILEIPEKKWNHYAMAEVLD